MRYFRFAQNSPKNDIHVKQESNPPLLGIVGDKKSSPFFNLGVQSPIFCTQNYKKWPFWVQKNGTSDAQIQKRRPFFATNYPQKW